MTVKELKDILETIPEFFIIEDEHGREINKVACVKTYLPRETEPREAFRLMSERNWNHGLR